MGSTNLKIVSTLNNFFPKKLCRAYKINDFKNKKNNISRNKNIVRYLMKYLLTTYKDSTPTNF